LSETDDELGGVHGAISDGVGVVPI
jgi:hypothetical protein